MDRDVFRRRNVICKKIVRPVTSSDDFYEVPSYPLAPFPSGSKPVKPRFFKVAMESSCPNATAMCCVEISEPWDLDEFDY